MKDPLGRGLTSLYDVQTILHIPMQGVTIFSMQVQESEFWKFSFLEVPKKVPRALLHAPHVILVLATYSRNAPCFSFRSLGSSSTLKTYLPSKAGKQAECFLSEHSNALDIARCPLRNTKTFLVLSFFFGVFNKAEDLDLSPQ